MMKEKLSEIFFIDKTLQKKFQIKLFISKIFKRKIKIKSHSGLLKQANLEKM